jgi:predicted RND superfamily exporter protein
MGAVQRQSPATLNLSRQQRGADVLHFAAESPHASAEQCMKKKIASLYERLVLRRPLVTLAILAVILGGFSTGISNFKVDASTDVLFREGDKDLRAFLEMSLRYETPEFLFIAVVPPNDLVSDANIEFISTLRDEITEVPQVLDVLSILDIPLLYSMPGEAFDVWFNLRTLRTPEIDRDRARLELTQSPLYQDFFASSDGKVTGMGISLKPHAELPRLRGLRDQLLYQRIASGLDPQQEIELEGLTEPYTRAREEAAAETHKAIEQIRAIIATHQGEAELYFGGLPMITDDIVSFIGRDLITFGAGVFAFLIVMLTLIFRELRWVILPFASCIYASLVMLGLLGLLGWSVTVVSSNFIALMLIITMSMNIHLVVRYRELFRDFPEASQFELVSLTVRHMAQPCLFTAITTVIAFSSLLISDIQPVIDFGWMMTISLVVVFVTSFTLFPALLALTKKSQLARADRETYPFTASLGRFTEKFGGAVLILAVLLAVVGAAGIQRLEVEQSFISYFHKDTEIYRGLKLIDESLGGTTPLEVLLKFPQSSADADMGSLTDDLAAMFGEVDKESERPESWFTQDRIDRVKAVHDYLEGLPEIGKVLSLASVMRVAEAIGGKEFTAQDLGELNESILAGVRAIVIDPYVSAENDEARVTVRIRDSMPDLRRKDLLDAIDTQLREGFGLGPEDYEITGLQVLYSNFLQSLFRSQILTLGLVMIGIVLILALLFSSLKVALVGVIPNILAATTILGFMGWMKIPLDFVTITVAAITIGIAVDDCIHYLYRYKVELVRLKDPIATMHYCHNNIAKAAFYTTVTITVGFSILLLSNFIPTIRFGLLTAVAMSVALLGALTLMPKLILMLRPFDEPNEEDW